MIPTLSIVLATHGRGGLPLNPRRRADDSTQERIRDGRIPKLFVALGGRHEPVLRRRDRLFTFRDLGFEDHRPDMRGVGRQRPEVVIVCEKVALQPVVERLAEHFGASWTITNGFPKLQGAERFAEELRKLIKKPLQVLACVDYDPWGWSIVDTFVTHMARFDVATDSLHHVVTPDRFTERELRLYSYAVKPSPNQATLIRKWVQRSGGIGGKARGIHSDHLLPYNRVEKAMEDALSPNAERTS